MRRNEPLCPLDPLYILKKRMKIHCYSLQQKVIFLDLFLQSLSVVLSWIIQILYTHCNIYATDVNYGYSTKKYKLKITKILLFYSLTEFPLVSFMHNCFVGIRNLSTGKSVLHIKRISRFRYIIDSCSF